MFVCNTCSTEFNLLKGLRVHQHNCLYMQLNTCNNNDNITANKKSRTNTVVLPKNESHGIKEENGQIQDTTEVELDSSNHLQSTTSDINQTSAEYRVCVELFGNLSKCKCTNLFV